MGPTRQITSVKVRDSSLAGTDINEATLANNHGANGSLAFGSLGVRVGGSTAPA